MELPTFRRLWATVRPRSRRGALLGIGLVAGAGALFAPMILLAATTAWTPYLRYTLQPDINARAQAVQTAGYAGAGECASCHQAEVAATRGGEHQALGCQGCHGAGLAHVLAPRAAPASVNLVTPTEDACVRCHTRVAGRPATLQQVVTADHFLPVCLQCHDPHTAIAREPPVVQHPLDNLPPCLVCHGSDGFKARNQRHPEVTADDRTCLLCHAAGRGPTDAGAGR